MQKQWLWVWMLPMAVSSCVLKSQHDQTVAAYIKSSDELSRTSKDAQACQKKLSDVESRLSEAEARNQELSETNQTLASKNKDLTEKSSASQQAYQKILDERQARESVGQTRFFDQLNHEFKKELTDGSLSAHRDHEGVLVSFKGKGFLPKTGTTLTPQTVAYLNRMLPLLRGYSEAQITLRASTDPKVMKLKNKHEASFKFGLAVARHLIKSSVPSTHIRVLAVDWADSGLEIAVR